MKKLLIIPLIMIVALHFAYAQTKYTKDDIKTVNKLLWFGLDLSKAKLVNGFYHPKDVQDAYIRGWNDYILSPDYNLKNLLKKDSIVIDLSVVTKRNKDRCNYYYKLIPDTIQSAIHDFQITQKDGIGLILFVDEFDNAWNTARIWIVFFDILEKKILLAKQFSAKAGGTGMVNHWSKAIRTIIKEIPDTYK